jgi:hypothetical protein
MMACVNWLVLVLMVGVLIFELMLWRLTGFWAFLVFGVAHLYVAATRLDLIINPHANTAAWVFFFWPMFMFGTIGLYLSFRKNMRR